MNKASRLLLKMFLVAGFVLLSLTLFSITKQTYNKNEVQEEIDKLMIKAKQIEKENIEIKDKIAYLESNDFREKEAKDKLNLQKPGENVVVIKPGIIKETQTNDFQENINYPEKKIIQNRIKWWSYFFGY